MSVGVEREIVNKDGLFLIIVGMFLLELGKKLIGYVKDKSESDMFVIVFGYVGYVSNFFISFLFFGLVCLLVVCVFVVCYWLIVVGEVDGNFGSIIFWCIIVIFYLLNGFMIFYLRLLFSYWVCSGCCNSCSCFIVWFLKNCWIFFIFWGLGYDEVSICGVFVK